MTKCTPRLPKMSAVECREQLLKPLDALPVTQTGGRGGVEGGSAREAYCDVCNASPEHVGSCVTTEEQRRVFPCMPNMPQHMHQLPHELSDSAVSNGLHTDSDSSSTVHTHSCPSSTVEDWQEEDSQTDFYPSPIVKMEIAVRETISMDSSSHVDSSDCYLQRGHNLEKMRALQGLGML